MPSERATAPPSRNRRSITARTRRDAELRSKPSLGLKRRRLLLPVFFPRHGAVAARAGRGARRTPGPVASLTPCSVDTPPAGPATHIYREISGEVCVSTRTYTSPARARLGCCADAGARDRGGLPLEDLAIVTVRDTALPARRLPVKVRALPAAATRLVLAFPGPAESGLIRGVAWSCRTW